jgi:hypothetical protein
LELNCTMTNVMHNFLIYLSIYFCLTCFGLSFSPSAEAGGQLQQWFRSAGYGVSTQQALTSYPVSCAVFLHSKTTQLNSECVGPFKQYDSGSHKDLYIYIYIATECL